MWKKIINYIYNFSLVVVFSLVALDIYIHLQDNTAERCHRVSCLCFEHQSWTSMCQWDIDVHPKQT